VTATIASREQLIGRTAELELIAASIDAGRHVLVEGAQGVGKSMLIAAACRRLHSRPVIVHGSAGTTVGTLVGNHDPAAVLRGGYTHESFVAGPLIRVPADVLNVLIGPMSEGALYVPRYRNILAAPGFRVIATVNPRDGAGTAALPTAFVDRVVRLRLDYQSFDEELAIVRSNAVGVDEQLQVRAVQLARRSRRHPDVRIGASIRAAIDLVTISQFLGLLSDAPRQDVELRAALLAASSKITLRSGVGRTVESIITELWEDVTLRGHRARSSPGRALPPSSVQLELDDTSTSQADDMTFSRPPGEGRAADGGIGGRSGARSSNQAQPDGASDGVTAETQQAVASFVRLSGRAAHHRRGRSVGSTPAESDLQEVERLAAGIVVGRVRGQLPIGTRSGGRITAVRYSFRSDDLDIDRTVAELLDRPVPVHTDLWVHDRVPRRRGVVLILDISGSMRGARAIESATAAAATALATAQDELAVIVFGADAVVLKHRAETVPAIELARRVLCLRPRGLTNLSAGLAAGLEQLSGMRSAVSVAVVMTDGVQNHGADVLPIARRFPRLDVLATTDSPWRLRHCRALADAGRGRSVSYEHLDQLPAVLSGLLNG
jgi:MoxR-like ATPase/Mg-chelatase subunit ChlD